MGRDTREQSTELRAIAPLIVTGPAGSRPQLVGPCTLVTNGTQTIAFSSAELLRRAGEPLAIALTLDCTHTIPVTSWLMSRSPHMGIIELGTAFPAPHDTPLDVAPLPIGSVYATVDTRGAPSALIAFEQLASGTLKRRMIPVHVDAIDGGGMSDDIITLASPDEVADIEADVEGAALITWMPADPVLGRPQETVLVALACTYRQAAFKPRDLPPVGELFGLEDLGRALPWTAAPKEASSNELGQIAGEIKAVPDGPLSGFDGGD